MGREIKFRGLDVMTGEWVYGNLVQTGVGMKYIIPKNFIADEIPQWKVDKETVGQYTGLTDRNDKEIYEGDIVKYLDAYGCSTENGYDFSEFDNVGVIEWEEEEMRYSVTNRENIDLETFWESKHIEVMGNIYEHPELLEGDK